MNYANPDVHYQNTGKEIIEQVEHIDCFVSGVGSGGTISGIGKRIKETYNNALIVAMQPAKCDVLKGKAIPHEIKGTTLGTIPKVFDVNIVDEVVSVRFEEVEEVAQKISREEGLLLGISSCANICAALKIGKKLGKGHSVVTIAPDTGKNYLNFYNELFGR